MSKKEVSVVEIIEHDTNARFDFTVLEGVGENDIISILVKGDTNDMGGSEPINRTYKGPAFAVIKKIADDYSYFQFADDEDLGSSSYASLADMCKEIEMSNGDGCAFLTEFVISK